MTDFDHILSDPPKSMSRTQGVITVILILISAGILYAAYPRSPDHPDPPEGNEAALAFYRKEMTGEEQIIALREYRTSEPTGNINQLALDAFEAWWSYHRN